jgi:hypothetical protein
MSWRLPNFGFFRTIFGTVARNPISFLAVVFVGLAAWRLDLLTDRLLDVLESPKWCGNAIQAEKISPGNSFKGLESCLKLLEMQLSSMGTALLLTVGTMAFSLVVLVVVVMANARAKATLPGGMDIDIGTDPNKAAARAAEHVVEGAEEAAEEVKGG